MSWRIAIIAYLLLLTIIILCCLAVLLDFSVDYTKIGLCLAYILSNLWLFEAFVITLANLESNLISVERLKQYFSNETEHLDDRLNEIALSQSESERIIVFENVYFTYETQPLSPRMRYALENVSFSIRRGEKVAICGRTASGKSSILNVLFRFYNIDKGRILLNGIPIDTMRLIDLRQYMSIIPQLGFLFKGTLRDNLDPRNEFSDESIITKFIQTGIVIRGVNSSSSRNEESDLESSDPRLELKFEIQNLGSNLSNGEKQMINFMRVFIQTQDLVCLDEANSNIDAETDYLVMKALFEVCHDKTILMISHRLENLRMFDRIMVLDEGHLVEFGSFTELVANPNSRFNVLRNSRNRLKS
eukprot:TRINITY_DN2975_c0_g2_i9.p1 TRINITY_DN2975_c0_g2~~TRINITY_DN2975_c0_g2_i9.p1  ORF type:complete len:360 (-),score=39.20 TRINITY_DN2975_c0_g2_i9:91-1170(-)